MRLDIPEGTISYLNPSLRVFLANSTTPGTTIPASPIEIGTSSIPYVSEGGRVWFRVRVVNPDAGQPVHGANVKLFWCTPSVRPQPVTSLPILNWNVNDDGGNPIDLQPNSDQQSGWSPEWNPALGAVHPPGVPSGGYFHGCLVAVAEGTNTDGPTRFPLAASDTVANPAQAYPEVAQKNLIVTPNIDEVLNQPYIDEGGVTHNGTMLGTGIQVGNPGPHDERVTIRVRRVSRMMTESLVRSAGGLRELGPWSHAPEVGFEIAPIETAVQIPFAPAVAAVAREQATRRATAPAASSKPLFDARAARRRAAKIDSTEVLKSGRVQLPNLDFKSPLWASQPVALYDVRSAAMGSFVREFGVAARTQRPMIFATAELPPDVIRKRGGNLLAMFLIEEVDPGGRVLGGIGYIRRYSLLRLGAPTR